MSEPPSSPLRDLAIELARLLARDLARQQQKHVQEERRATPE
jgi:hypothetical protein